MSIQTLEKEQTENLELSGSRWVVIIYNDEKTFVGFVIEVLMTVFGKTEGEAVELTRTAEATGSAAVKYYTDPSLAEIALSMVEALKVKKKQPDFTVKIFEIIK